MDNSNSFLDKPHFQKFILGIFATCFGTGLSAAYSIGDYMASIKAEFSLLRNEIESVRREERSQIEEIKRLIQLENSHQEKQLQLIKQFVTRNENRINRLIEKN